MCHRVRGLKVGYLMKIVVIGWIGCYPPTWLRFFLVIYRCFVVEGIKVNDLANKCFKDIVYKI